MTDTYPVINVQIRPAEEIDRNLALAFQQLDQPYSSILRAGSRIIPYGGEHKSLTGFMTIVDLALLELEENSGPENNIEYETVIPLLASTLIDDQTTAELLAVTILQNLHENQTAHLSTTAA